MEVQQHWDKGYSSYVTCMGNSEVVWMPRKPFLKGREEEKKGVQLLKHICLILATLVRQAS